MLPLLHWLPPRMYRNILRRLNKPFFAQEENLNLLSRKDLTALMKAANCTEYAIKHIRFLGFKSNIILIIKTEG
jgi:putative heme iron utilization protein